MFFSAKISRRFSGLRKAMALLIIGVVLAASGTAIGQRRFSRSYPAAQNVRIHLINRSGTVTVVGWDRQEVAITASLDAPAAAIMPQNVEGTIFVNLVRDNQGRDVGNVNFNIRVPYTASVDIETLIGNLNVTNVL